MKPYQLSLGFVATAACFFVLGRRCAPEQASSPPIAEVQCQPKPQDKCNARVAQIAQREATSGTSARERRATPPPSELQPPKVEPPKSESQRCPPSVMHFGQAEAPAAISCVCPSDANLDASVWGTDVYTGDSDICAAAKHAGVSGEVTVYVHPGQPSYLGIERNGVVSRSFMQFARSFSFNSSPDFESTRANENQQKDLTVTDESPSPNTQCPYSSRPFRQRHGVGESFSCKCSAKAAAEGQVWGTTIYSEDSSICTAARHAGTWSADGDEVTVYVLPGQKSYQGSDANGIKSLAYGQWQFSFSFSPP